MLRPPKARRASRPKVRTGCRSCKQRRIKCDETKPDCLRCKKFGCKCDGYDSQSSTSTQSCPEVGQPSLRPLASRPLLVIASSTTQIHRKIAPLLHKTAARRDSAHQGLISRAQVHQPHAIRGISLGTFHTEEDYRYFNHFYTKTASTLRGYFPSDIFSELVPQISNQDPLIRQTVTAIGALTQSIDSRIDQSGKGFSLEALNDTTYWTTRHYQSAIKRYDKAVQLMRREALSFIDNQHLQKTLVFCLLIAFFETFHGSPQGCLKAIEMATKILIPWLKRSSPGMKALALSGIKSPAPYLVTDEILHVFSRLDRQMATSLNTRTAWSFKDDETEVLRCMPGRFSDIKEGRIYWEVLSRQMAHAKGTSPMQLDHKRFTLKARVVASDMSPNDIENINAAIRSWSSAFDPVYLSSRSSGDGHIILVAAILVMRAKLAAITFPGEFSTHETFYDCYSSHFWDIISLGKFLQEDLAKIPKSENIRPRFDTGPSVTFYHLAIRCRDRKIRRAALEIADSCPKLDGLMGIECDIFMSIANFIRQTEENGLPDDVDIVPEWARVCPIDITFLGDLSQRHGLLRYTTLGDQFSSNPQACEVDIVW